ncbi:tellurite resistance TerB C-terminal domain-containing protein [Adhaeribacter swui]|nr:tellurite resistance TerB C-terminal domain-containing protein [Adhaeribacter swui]
MKILLIIFRWILGIFLCLVSIGGFASGDIGPALFMLTLGLLLLPPIAKAVFRRKRKKDSKVRSNIIHNPPFVEKPSTEQPAKEEWVKKVDNGVMSNSNKDDSIIDVSGFTYQINHTVNSSSQKTRVSAVPYWSHQYVYSYSEINAASPEQIEFYKRFKTSFLDGEYLDLQGNTNYAFILLFDLLNNDYEKHKDLARLENELNILGFHYPKTESYGTSFLIQKMSAAGDSAGIARLRNTQSNYQNSYLNNYEYDSWKLGTKYKTKLDLKEEEVKLLNKLWNPGNNFCGIEFCLIEVLKLYLVTINELENVCREGGTSLTGEFEIVSDIVARKHFKYRKNSSNYKYSIESTTNELYILIFKHCENAVREHYGHKRKISTTAPYHAVPDVLTQIENRIVTRLNKILPNLLTVINPPDEATETELNIQNTSRWKTKFDEITYNFKGVDGKKFIEDIKQLGNLNQKNPSLENIYFEASKFIAKTDREAALILYVYYLYYDLQSVAFNNKQLTKTIQKSLFKTEGQLHDFESILKDLIIDRDLDKALQSVPRLYIPKRKKIQLNTEVIKEVQQLHSGTVELLNEYLQEEEDSVAVELTEKEGVENLEATEISFERLLPQTVVTENLFVDGLILSGPQSDLLRLFSNNNFSLTQQDVESFSKSKGLMRSQLIDSINENCFDQLDDVLIEEDGDYFTIYENYFKQLIKI